MIYCFIVFCISFDGTNQAINIVAQNCVSECLTSASPGIRFYTPLLPKLPTYFSSDEYYVVVMFLSLLFYCLPILVTTKIILGQNSS